MRVNIYYGGRGLIEDPTLYVINKLTEVLEEIRVEVVRYNLFEQKNGITILPKTLKEADGVILATTVEWLGIGGFMQQFLDACWLYADKEYLSKLYMMPVVTSNTFGEREAELYLIKSWEILGGILCNGIRTYVEDAVEFETNKEYALMIEKQAELFYKSMNQKTKVFPASNAVIRKNLPKNATIDFTPQESEQLSMYVSNDTYVKKQKEDIEELTQIFKGMLGGTETKSDDEFIGELKNCFRPKMGVHASFSIAIAENKKVLVIEVDEAELKCYYSDHKDADVIAKTSHDVMNKIVEGQMTMQRAFMSGELTAKGDFSILRSFDEIFLF